MCVCLQELTEEGKSFLLLFYHADDTTIIETFRRQVALQLLDMKSTLPFTSLTALPQSDDYRVFNRNLVLVFSSPSTYRLHTFQMYTMSPQKMFTFLFFKYLCQKLTDFNDFWGVKS